MNSHFQYIKAIDYCKRVFDGTHNTPKPTDDGMPLITSKHITPFALLFDDAYNISIEDYNDINKRSQVSQWDILFSMIGTIGNLYLEKSADIKYAIKNMGVFSCGNKEKATFLYYYLQSPVAKQHIQSYLNGAVQKFLPLGALRDFPVPAYSEDYNKLTKILSSIDDKIELNNKINKELEQMAKTLYDYWFVQFEFPDGIKGAYKSSNGPMTYNEVLKREIPVGWEVKNVDELCDVLTGKEDANFATPDGKYAFFTCGDDILRCDKAVFQGKSILIAGNGNFNVKYYEGEFNAYQRTYVLIPEDEIYIGVMYRAMLDSISRFTKGSNGSIVKFITKGDIANTKVIIPSNKELLKPLNNILSSIEKNKEQNQKLAEIRDFLLPMLMNGQVKVEQ